MRKPWVLIVLGFVFFLVIEANGNIENKIQETLIMIKQLEFENAKKKLKSEYQNLQTQQLIYLIELIELNTFSEKNANLFNSPNLLDFSENESLIRLIKGYEALYIKNFRIIAFENFSQGLISLEDNENEELKKALLIGIFKVMVNGYSISNEKFQKYLNAYKATIKDDIDLFWYHFYQIQLFLRTTDYHKDKHESPHFYEQQLDSINELGSAISLNRFTFLIHKINGDYYVKYDGEKALEHFTIGESLLGKNIYDDTFRYRIKIDKACSIAKSGMPRSAIDTIHAAKNLIEFGNKMTNTLNHNFFLSEFFYQIGNSDSSIVYLKNLFQLRKQSNHESINQRVSELEVALETTEKEKQIFKEQQKVRANRNWLIAVSIALILGTGITVLIHKNTVKKRRIAEQETQLKQQRVENLLREQELVSIDAMIEGQEKERQKVANELHDDLGSLMATIKLHFENTKVSTQDPALKSAQKLLEEAYQKIRGMAHSKNSGVMSDQGLLPAIKKMAKSISESNALQVTVEDFGLGERMENSLELSIFRMVQELVANTIKHAEATKVNIQLTQHEDNLNIIVEDNGKGFDRSKLDKEKVGMGLTNIEKRVEHLEGNFTVDGVLGKGTSILIDIPV